MTSLRAFLARLLGTTLLLAAAIPGCDYFRPAQPEAPSSASSFVPDFTSPDSTLSTIGKAIEDKGLLGSSAYRDAFADTNSAGSIAGYHQFFWPLDVADWKQNSKHDPPDDWDYNLEQAFYPRFVRVTPQAYSMAWAPDPSHPDDIGANTATIHRHYVITAHAADGTLTQYLAIGFADLTLLRFPDGNWRLIRWEDRRDPDADPNDTDQVTLGSRRLNTVT
jgi:hypothetical protein